MRIAVPNKGRLHEPTMELLERAGLQVESGADRKLYADTVDPEVTVLYVRAADIPEYVRDGAAEMGITGLDQVRESGHELTELLDLEYGRCRLVLAAPEESGIDAVEDLAGRTVATEFPTITRRYFDERGIDPEIVRVTGATELTPHVEMADAIVDITSTGTTLAVNRLEIVDEVLSSSVRLFVRPDAADDGKVRQVATALDSVLAAEGKRYLMMNAPRGELDRVREVIPGMGGPTVMDIAGEGRGSAADGADNAGDGSDGGEGGDVAVHAVVDERDVFATISKLKEAGASDILVTEIERLVE